MKTVSYYTYQLQLAFSFNSPYCPHHRSRHVDITLCGNDGLKEKWPIKYRWTEHRNSWNPIT